MSSSGKGIGWVITLHNNPLTIKEQEPDDDHRNPLPSKSDFRDQCSPIKDQGRINSASAYAVIGLAQHFQKKHFVYYIDSSVSFLYYAAKIRPPIPETIRVILGEYFRKD